jgi:hypothetical protein
MGAELLAWVFSWKGAAIQSGLEHGSRGIAIVRSRYQANTIEDTAGWKRLGVCESDLWSVEIRDGAVIKCNYEFVTVVNKSNSQSKTPSKVTPSRNSIIRGYIWRVGAGITKGYKIDGPSSIPGRARFFSSPQSPDRLWGPPSLQSNGYLRQLHQE